MPVLDEMDIEDIEIDPETGLPLLPEGQFWRVGRKDRPRDMYPRYYIDTYEDVNYGEGVFLMGPKRRVERTTETPVYGVGWYRNKVVRYDTNTFYEDEEEVIDFRSFSSFIATSKDVIPEFGTYTFKYDNTERCYFDVSLSEEGIAFVASSIMSVRLAAERRQKQADEKARKAQELKDKFYGDYPPKKLGI